MSGYLIFDHNTVPQWNCNCCKNELNLNDRDCAEVEFLTECECGKSTSSSVIVTRIKNQHPSYQQHRRRRKRTSLLDGFLKMTTRNSTSTTFVLMLLILSTTTWPCVQSSMLFHFLKSPSKL